MSVQAARSLPILRTGDADPLFRTLGGCSMMRGVRFYLFRNLYDHVQDLFPEKIF